jgi:hypothetical protein
MLKLFTTLKIKINSVQYYILIPTSNSDLSFLSGLLPSECPVHISFMHTTTFILAYRQVCIHVDGRTSRAYNDVTNSKTEGTE